ncbi:hypothetical protein LTR36_000875 [Oleoguttula mirabilis]|uniref:Uncharacterized protein n=1 Tax=Oleoguttula mirabilis TaxID=1507867 RepID=A0AAV9J2Y1_9PEZI|nr:hypothetical protein LTR36_000875 [Oleoguttula mirabilis]
MRTTTLLTALAAACLAAASPYPRAAAADLTDFLLVTTTQCPSTANSSALANVAATSLFDPYDQQNYLLRTIDAGYGSLPTFNLTSGDLHTAAVGPEGVGNYVYNSTGTVTAGQELQLSPAAESAGNLGLKDGYLLTVGGLEVGWTICDGALEQHVIYWKGNASSCTPTYIHAVAKAPY